MAKRYYWLKLPDGFFRQKAIKKLRKIAGGDTYTIIYLKMLLVAMKQDGRLYFEGVEATFYDELALDLDEEVENVRVTVMFLIQQDLITKLSTFLKDMVGTGILIPDEELEDYVREAANLPERTEVPDSREKDERREAQRRAPEKTANEKHI